MAGRGRKGGTSSRGAEAIGSLGGNISPHPSCYTLYTRTHTQMSGVAKSPGKSISFQYGLLLGTRDAETWSPLLRDLLICDKSCPCILIILFQLEKPIPTLPNYTLFFLFYYPFSCRRNYTCIQYTVSAFCLFKVHIILIQFYQMPNCDV